MADKINNFKRLQDEDEQTLLPHKQEVKNVLDKNINNIHHAENLFDHFFTKIAHTIVHFAGGKDDNLPNPSDPPKPHRGDGTRAPDGSGKER